MVPMHDEIHPFQRFQSALLATICKGPIRNKLKHITEGTRKKKKTTELECFNIDLERTARDLSARVKLLASCQPKSRN